MIRTVPMRPHLPVLFVLVMIATGCDIAGQLIVKDRTNAPARICFVYRDTTMRGCITVPAKRTVHVLDRRVIRFSWAWTDANIDVFTADLERIDLITATDSTAYAGEELKALLREGRRGWLKKTEVIKVR